MLVLYVVAWMVSLISFWFNFSNLVMESWAMWHLSLLMSAVTFCLAAAVGARRQMGSRRWLLVPLAGLSLVVLAALTLIMGLRMPDGEALLTGVGMPLWAYGVTGMVVALLGMWGGLVLRRSRRRRLARMEYGY